MRSPTKHGGQPPQKIGRSPTAVSKGCRCHPGGRTHPSSCRASSTNHGPLALADPTLTPLFFWGGEKRGVKHARRGPGATLGVGSLPSALILLFGHATQFKLNQCNICVRPSPGLTLVTFFSPPLSRACTCARSGARGGSPRAQPPANALGSLLGGSCPVLWSCEAKRVLLKCLRWVLGVPPPVSWPWCRAPARRPCPHPCPLAQRGRGAGTGAFPVPTPWGVPPA